MRMTRRWRRTVKVVLQAASINENSQFTHGEHDPAIRAPTVASMQRSGIEGAGQKFWVREVTHSRRQKAHKRSGGSKRCLKAQRYHAGSEIQNAEADNDPFFQSLPPNGSDFSTMTHRLRPSSKPATWSWACHSAPRFHFVASRLRWLARSNERDGYFTASTYFPSTHALVGGISAPKSRASEWSSPKAQ